MTADALTGSSATQSSRAALLLTPLLSKAPPPSTHTNGRPVSRYNSVRRAGTMPDGGAASRTSLHELEGIVSSARSASFGPERILAGAAQARCCSAWRRSAWRTARTRSRRGCRRGSRRRCRSIVFGGASQFVVGAADRERRAGRDHRADDAARERAAHALQRVAGAVHGPPVAALALAAGVPADGRGVRDGDHAVSARRACRARALVLLRHGRWRSGRRGR